MFRTAEWHLRNMWRRHRLKILYYTALLVITLSFANLSGMVKVRQQEKRDVEEKQSALAAVNIDGEQLDRVKDDELAEWVSLLLNEKNGAKKNDTEMSAPVNAARSGQESIQILGEGGSRHHSMRRSSKHENHPELPVEALPISRDLRRRLIETKAKVRQASVNARNKIISPDKDEPGRIHQGMPTVIREKPVEIEGQNNGSDHSVRYERYSSEHQNTTKRMNVLIVAAMRTGSSFLGELFQQRKDFFYMFEPGMLLMHKLDSSNLTRRVMVTKLIDMLEKFYHCKFHGVPFFIDLLNQKTLHARKQAIPALVSDQFCRRVQSRHSRPKDMCEPVSIKALESACTSRPNTAIKSIRILDINLMQALVQEPDVNLKIIHIVRDPRSMIISRLKLIMPSIKLYNVTELTDTYRNILIRYCSNWLQNYEIGHYVPFIRKNYLLVRYEDLALEPFKYAQKVYDFVGVGAEIPPEMRLWIAQNTQVNDPSEKKSAAFSTTRDSKSVLVGWKKRITHEMAQAIEEVGDCTRLMEATGYTLIGSDLEKLNSPDHLVSALPQPKYAGSDFDFM
ncbi:carbohydrate sulfotransferase 1-like [Diadema antillarum]|uniref:carbohydrate sulfotransferase 1-like n=1 Tax=Diadema antillarum TaxID=105358 RepID=UPI003A85A8E6